MSSPTDSIVVTTVVAADASTTFALFTEDVNLWWKQGPRFRGAGGTLRFEPGEEKKVQLVKIAGEEIIRGGNALISNHLSDKNKLDALKRASENNFLGSQ